MTRRICIAVAFSVLIAAKSMAIPLEGSQLYRVSTVRAAPGALATILEWAVPKNTRDFYVMRHSQGDHWDLMFVLPLDRPSFEPIFTDVEGLIAFREDTFAYGPPKEVLSSSYEKSGLFHIEMFAALPGKTTELLEQRRMENVYLGSTGQRQNLIFRGVAGTDVDVFTIGFHQDLETFAAPAPASDEEKEEAAKSAGFKSRADISFYLRSLIAKHQDTLAVTVE